MIDKKIFSNLRKELTIMEQAREKLIVDSRPILKNSKQAIYALHKNSKKEAAKLLEEAKKGILALKKSAKESPNVGAYNAALQEYGEAVTYYYFVTEDRLISNKDVDIDAENYLLGVCDLTGELSRRAVFSVVNEDYKEVKRINEFMQLIYHEFMDFELRNGELRKKSDSVKWNMKKVEEILYDLKIRGKI